MRRGINRLRPLQIERFKGPGKVSDGGGLYLIIGRNGSRTWVFRYTRQGKAVELGLGAVASVPVTEARAAAGDLRGALVAGEDPRAHRDRQRRLVALKHARSVTFEKAAERYIEANKAGWRNAKHAAQWTTTLTRYAYPVFATSAVADVTAADILKVLSPIWSSKPETASRLRGRIEAVLDYGKVHGWRDGENPARWKGGLEMTLPARGKVRRIKHHAAMPYADVPALLKTLAVAEGVAPLALRFVILTAVRTGEAIGARWMEIDTAARLWTIPVDRMKAGREHRVPLCNQACEVLEQLPRVCEWVFPGRKIRTGLSNMSLLQTLRRLEQGNVTTHGFRSSFRDWAAEQTTFPREVIESALAHTLGTKVETAYLRSDLLDKRRGLMEAWGRHCAGLSDASHVLELRPSGIGRTAR
jgi:integrase